MDTANNDYYIYCTTFTNMPFKKIIKGKWEIHACSKRYSYKKQ